MNKNTLFAILTPLVVAAAGVAGFYFYEGTPGTTDQRSVSETDVAEAPETGSVTVRSTPSETESEDNSADDETPLSTGLVLNDWAVDGESDTPRACFEFNQKLDEDDRVSLRDYVSTTPNAQVSLSVENQYLCLSGFDYDRDYTVVLREGLPAASGDTLNVERRESVTFGDKPKFVGFAGDGIILPRIGAQGLAIETVNVDSLDVEIALVSDRMIARRDPQSGRVTLEGDYGWEYEDAAKNIREVIWSGAVDVDNTRNEKVTTVLPLQDLVGELKPGAYVVTAERGHTKNEDQIARAWRWIISTDLALTSYRGQDGLTVSARSIDTAKLLPGTDIVLVADNNDIIASETADSAGHVFFPAPLLKGKGPKRPKMLLAYGANNDFAMLDLSRAPLDLSEYDVDGRNESGKVDIYGFPERGVYRPGETAHFTIMLRDATARAGWSSPVKFTVQKPNGVEMFSDTLPADRVTDHAGTITWDYEVPESAPRGVWSLIVTPEGTDISKRVQFSVEDFVPQKLKLAIDLDTTPIKAGEIRDVSLDAQFLYGAPGAALDGEAEARIRIDPNPFPEFSDYSFGPEGEDFREKFIDMGSGVTDGSGVLTLALDARNNNIQSPFPLRAEITAGVAEPGGRYVRDSVRVPVRSEPIYLGLDPAFEGNRIRRGQAANIDLIALNMQGERIAQDVTWTLIEEDWDYHWYRENGRWRYRRDVRDIPINEGSVSISENEPASWSQRLPWGNYRLDIENAEGQKSGYRFSVGWGQAGETDSPDKLSLGVSQDIVSAGDMVSLTVNAPYAGEAELVIANDRIRMVKPLSFAEGPAELSFKFDPKWGSSAYALMTLYTPRDVADRPVPRRAVGVSYIELDRSGQTLNLEIESPDVVRPNTSQTFTVNVDNAPRGESVWMNFAAVDEGILQLTKYQSPDAAEFYFGKKALNVDIRDDYGRMLNANLGDPAIARSGSDSLGGEGLTVVPTKTVSLFSGPVKVSGGEAEVTLDMPQFNGELRLMATAWSKSAVGSASSSVKLRDRVPAIVGLPRFMAPGDRAIATVSLDNVEGQAGTYTADLAASDLLNADGQISLDLQPGQRKEGRLQVIASSTGVDQIDVSISGPDYGSTADYPLQVRSAFMPITTASTRLLGGGESFSITPDLIAGYVPGSADVTVSFSRLPGLDATPIVESLARYPYGCTEQTISTALPLLYAGELGGIPGQTEFERRRGLNKAVARLASRQGLDGSFGLWRAGDRNARPWLGVYATDFLYRAKDEGLLVSADVLDRASDALAEISLMPRYASTNYDWPNRNSDWGEQSRAEAAAYAHYVMARTGQGNLSQMRYFYDNHSGKIRTSLAMAYIASALEMMGDEGRSQVAMSRTLRMLGYEDENDYYQSSLRDVAGVISAFSEAGLTEQSVELAGTLRESIEDVAYMHTNEKAHVVLALSALMAEAENPDVSAQNANLGGTDKKPTAQFYAGGLSGEASFTNRDDGNVWATITVSGSPADAPAPVANGFELSKSVFRMNGQAADLSKASQGDRFVVKVAFNSTRNRSRTAVLADLLPAGFEIETILTPEDGARRNGVKGAYAWVGNIAEFQVTEARDDRFVASLETYRQDEYIAAYIVRAVTPGDFVIPGAVLEDMYRPEDKAITQAGRVVIGVDPSL